MHDARTDARDSADFSPDFIGESRHELVAKLAYENWEARGRPLGSPEIDWLAAERSLYEWLVAKGVVSEFPENGGSLENALYQ
jgi:hypothetical protein